MDPQRTQRITGSAFRISLQPDWRSRQTKQRPFLTGQSWRVLKSGYTAGSPEQGFRRCFADGVNQSLISSARRLSPLVCDIHNQSLREGYIPALLKSSVVTPIPKVSPPALIEQDLRPISLSCTLAKVMEGFTCSRLLPQLEGKVDPCQFSRKGYSTTDALIYMLQAIYEAVNSGEASARIFFVDFSKGIIQY